MKKFILVLITYFFLMGANAQPSYTQIIKGIIVDEQSNHFISDATVEVVNTNIATISNNEGNFVLSNVPIGRQSIKVTKIGYDYAVISSIEITSSKEVILEIKLREKIVKLEEVIVKSVKNKIKPINDAAWY